MGRPTRILSFTLTSLRLHISLAAALQRVGDDRNIAIDSLSSMSLVDC